MGGVVTPTRTIANLVWSQTGIDSRVIAYGVDPDIFFPGPPAPGEDAAMRAKLGIPEQVPVLLHVGRLDLDKQVDIVIPAGALAMRHNQAHFLIVGDGTEKAGLVQLCRKLEICERSHFPGYVTLQQNDRRLRIVLPAGHHAFEIT